MRLVRLRLEKYGCFDATTLALAAEPGRINLVVAPNGTGKSLLRQAFHDLLFDIPAQTPMKFRFGYTGMALHAEALADDGVAFNFGWARQGKPPRITDDPGRYAALRAQTTPRQLEQLFALDTVRLRAGGMDLQGGQTLSEALLSGTGELARPRRVLQEIDKRRAANWGQGKSKPPLNAALAALNDARKRMRASIERPEHRERAEREVQAQRDIVALARAERQRVAETNQRLHRIELTRPALRQRAEAQAWLDAHPGAPALPSSLEQDLADARAALSTAEAILRAAETGATAATGALGEIRRDEAASRHLDVLAGLPEQLGRAVEARRDSVTVALELSAAEASMRAELANIGSDVAVGAASSLVPKVGLLAEARAAILGHAGPLRAAALAATQLRAAERRLAEAAGAPMQAEPAPAGLADLLAEIRADRDPAHHARDLAKAERQTLAELQAVLARVPGWRDGPEALRALSVPQIAVFQRLDAARTDAARALGACTEQQEALAAKAEQHRRDLAALQETPLPDQASITAVRADRDQGWRLIHQRAFSSIGPDIAAEGAFAGGEPLPLAFERRLRVADGLADQRITELARITEAARLARELADLAAQGATAALAAGSAKTRWDEAIAAWEGAVACLGLGREAGMAELAEFLARRSAAIDAMKAGEIARGEAAALGDIHRVWAGRLAALLPGEPQAGLAELLAMADAALARAAASEATWLAWQAELRGAQRERQTEADRLANADREMAEWRATWEAILARLGRPAGETPAATGAVLDRIAELDKHTRAAAVARGRIEGMQAILDRFAALVDGLAQALDEPPQPDRLVMARTLVLRRDKAADASSAWTMAQQRVEQTAHVLEEAHDAWALAERQCRAIAAAAGALDLEEAESRIAASREHSRHSLLRGAALETLATHGGGLSLETLQQQADGVPPDTMGAARQAAQAEALEADARVEAGAIALRALEDAFAAGEDETRALEAAADYAAASAQYSRLLEEQLVLHLAHDMLQHALDAVQADAGEDGIARLSRIFSALTGGAYAVALSEEDGATLLAIETRFPGEPKTLEQLSEGTRDQLYLALRILALREHAAGAMPLPFIADDILQTFDDERAAAAMRVLIELSHEVQVIVLTHHAHLAGLAAGLGNGVHVLALA